MVYRFNHYDRCCSSRPQRPHVPQENPTTPNYRRRADERTRTADLISLRVSGSGLPSVARAYKSSINRKAMNTEAHLLPQLCHHRVAALGLAGVGSVRGPGPQRMILAQLAIALSPHKSRVGASARLPRSGACRPPPLRHGAWQWWTATSPRHLARASRAWVWSGKRHTGPLQPSAPLAPTPRPWWPWWRSLCRWRTSVNASQAMPLKLAAFLSAPFFMLLAVVAMFCPPVTSLPNSTANTSFAISGHEGK